MRFYRSALHQFYFRFHFDISSISFDNRLISFWCFFRYRIDTSSYLFDYVWYSVYDSHCITAQPALLRAMRNLRVVRRPHDGRLRPILPDFAHKLPNFSAILTDFIPETDLDPVCQAYWRWGCPNHPGRLWPSAETAELRVPFTVTSDSMSQKHKHIECSRAYYPSHISLDIPINHALACISTPEVSIVSEFRERSSYCT